MNKQTQILSGLYLLTDHHLTDKVGIVPAVAAAIQGGARIIQYRNKYANRERKLWEIRDLITLCRPLGIPLIVNDEADLAAETGADGVHLGAEDGTLCDARKLLGEEAIIGVSCYNSLDRARVAAEQGASYIALGRFFPSQTKPNAILATPDLLSAAKAELETPLVAIGGIDADNGKALVDAGADMLAVIHAVLGTPEITKSAAEIAALYE
ncbi:MAG: thiamine phosphate synthase [Gammaproteobacteria bacterium]|jgi:thiamine-phosphate pyrophosphorylase|nr:thiamine phosphate synthase [Gammaproteobacteria bacterium]MBT4608005.1 thiamine phosphate synthase [Thiotrichales bacterium]MBT3471473.1 thiamine phosphate synthase [Gammaproteobacteria bacterium]MBT3967100.1 thiamine phosphate synthase [Gammaproteobacteria bacterium]MBT4081718.1 thiamine phosphate synthase [Gammaproteobacteria bacterium]